MMRIWFPHAMLLRREFASARQAGIGDAGVAPTDDERDAMAKQTRLG
jgi:hypothetical protein